MKRIESGREKMSSVGDTLKKSISCAPASGGSSFLDDIFGRGAVQGPPRLAAGPKLRYFWG